ncbi:unnamed protein product, partial [Meganyctiphanes norvegica]
MVALEERFSLPEDVASRLAELQLRYPNYEINETIIASIINVTWPHIQQKEEEAAPPDRGWVWSNEALVLVPAYSVILLLSVVGNALVILTLLQNKRMRTSTNILLLNLAVSDLLLGVVCMPFTLTGFLLRDFIFGHLMCCVIPFLQAVSVSVSAWTLVTISLERFYGICYPLQARRWRSVSHAYICCSAVWLLSLIAMSPVAVTSTLHPIQGGRHKCREVWPSKEVEQVFTMFLLLVLLMVPLLLMLIAYIRIAQVLSQAIREEEVHTSNHGGSTIEMSNIGTPNGDRKFQHQASFTSVEKFRLRQQPTNKSILRRTNQEQFLKSKRRIIKMLTVVVVEFFVCWTPLYVINTAAQWVPNVIYGNLG